MAKKSSSKNALKGLFSKSEAGADGSREKGLEKTEGEKKKFKFLKFKSKSQKGSAGGRQQVLSAAESGNPAEDEEDGADTIKSKTKRSYLYATAPRSKSKEISYSELDLRKPKRFGTFSFGLRKSKNKDEENLSKSTFGLHDPSAEEKDKTHLDLRERELDQTNMKTRFSMSQPELDTSKKFDIPSPPPVATNESESPFTFPKQPQPVNTRLDASEPLTSGSALFDMHKKPPKAPIATIPELQLNDEELNVPAQVKPSAGNASSSGPVTHTETTSTITQPASSLPANHPPTVLDTSDHKAALVNKTVCTTDVLQELFTKTEIFQTESDSVALSHHQPHVPGTADRMTQSGEPFLGSVGSRLHATVTESPPVPNNDSSALNTGSATVHQDASTSPVERSTPGTAKSVSRTSGVSSDKSARPVSQEVVYRELYGSLFPQSFTSNVLSSLPNPPPKIHAELQLNDEELNVPAQVKPTAGNASSSGPVTHTETTSTITQPASSLPANQPPTVLNTSDHKAALVNKTVCTTDVLQESFTKTAIFQTESDSVALSHHQPHVPGTADRTTQSGEPFLGSVGSRLDATVTESPPVPNNDSSALNTGSATVHQDASASPVERSTPGTAKSVSRTSGVSSDKSARPVSQEVVYRELYGSLFPQSFTSNVLSSLPNPPPEIHAEMEHLNTRSKAVLIKTRECHREANVAYARVKTSHEFTGCSLSSTFTSHQSSTASGPQNELDFPLPSSLSALSEPVCPDIHYSQWSRSHSDVKSDSFGLIRETITSVPEVRNSAPPVSDNVISQGADAQVTDSKRRVVLVKELVTDETSADPGCPFLGLDKMSSAKDLEIKTEAPSGQMDGYEGLLSPAYLSVGSDDGSVMEIYYSADEGNSEESGEEDMYTVDEREDGCVVDGVKGVQLHEEQGPTLERRMDKRYEGDMRVVIVKMQSEEGDVGTDENTEDFICQADVPQQPGGQRADVYETKMSGFPVSTDTQSQQKAAAATAPPHAEEGEEGSKEELLATPVEQVNTVMICKVVPPSVEPHGQGEGSEGNWTQNEETEAHLYGEKRFPRLELQYVSYKDVTSTEYMHAVSSDSRGERVITPTFSEAEEVVEEEQVPEAAHNGGEASHKSIEADCHTATTTAAASPALGADGAEPQADAAECERDRAPRRSEGADTVTQSVNRNGEQVAVELPASDAEAHHPDGEATEAASERHGAPPEAQPDPDQGSLTADSKHFESQQAKAERESCDKMSAGVSSLSTTLSLKTASVPEGDESKHRIHKVSLISEAERRGVRDAADFATTSAAVSDSGDLGSEYKWKNKFDGVSQYKPSKTEESSFSSYSSTSSLSSVSALSEATAHEYPSSVFSSSYFSSSSSSEEHGMTGRSLCDGAEVYLSRDSDPAVEPEGEWGRSLVAWEESPAPAAEREGEEAERVKSHWDPQLLLASGFSSALETSHTPGSAEEDYDDDSFSRFTGVFKATFVQLLPDSPAPPSTPPDSPDGDFFSQFHMDNLVDTLKSMGPAQRPRTAGPRAPPQALVSSLPPIDEDAPIAVSTDFTDSRISPTTPKAPSAPSVPLNGLYTLPPDLGLSRSSARDTRSPLELMKQNLQDQHQPGSRGLHLPPRVSAASSILMKKSSDSSQEEAKSPVLNGNGVLPSSSTGSRLDNSILFRSYRSSSIDLPQENGKPRRPLFHANSLHDVGPASDRASAAPKEPIEAGAGADTTGPRFDRLSFLMNSSSSTSGSLSGAEEPSANMSRPSTLGVSSPPSNNSPTRLLSPTGSIDLHRPFAGPDSPLSLFGQTQGLGVGAGTASAPILQRSFSGERTAGVQHTSLFNSVHGGSLFQSQEAEPDRNLVLKYRAFPDAYLTKQKEHGKLNPRPGKMYIFDQPGMCGQRIEVRSDVIDATPWELQETISIRVVRGGWVLYEKPNFKGEKIALDEGDVELTCPFSPPEELMEDVRRDGEEHSGEGNEEQTETKLARRFIIGSIRRAVRDYSVPDISLFPEENAEGKKVIFRDTSEDARIFGFPVKANSIIINAGLWLVYAQPFFQGVPRVLEVGGYTNPAAWGVEQPYVGSLHPLKIGEPRVENMGEPKIVIYEKSYFTGKSRTITTNMRDFMTRTDRQQNVFMYNVGSLKVLGGIWVGYEKEGFRGHQYLLEEGDFHDWRVWGGHNAELRSVRLIRADLTDPLMVMIEQPEDELDMQEENAFEVTEAIPDVEPFGYKTSTRSIHVIGGAWVAYSHVDFSGDQYVLEKGFYSNCADWGSQDNRICSVQPILMAHSDDSRSRNELILYSEPDFQGNCHVFDADKAAVPEKLLTKSCRVVGGSWVLYENKEYSGSLYVLAEGDYPNLTSMGCPSACTIRSAKMVPLTLSVPSISLFGLECLEGREITTDTEILSVVEEGYNNHILSVKVNSGCWVICEHSNYRGRQFLLEPIEITNWPKFSSLHTIGSMHPVRQKRHFFRIKNSERGHFMSVQGGVEELKSGRIVVTPEVEPMSDIWFYHDGLIKNKLSPNMCLQVIGNVEPGCKVVLWTETRQPVQTWTAQMTGLITSITFPGLVLDVKGGKTYDKDHVVVMSENDERPSQQWEIELL